MREPPSKGDQPEAEAGAPAISIMTVQPEAEAHSSSLRPLDDVERTRSVESASLGS
jgi:hypothetical protein